MLHSTKFALFLGAAFLLAVAPGPGMLYVLARSLAGGKREGVLSALGTFVGGMVHVIAAAAGVSIILARSALAFATVKYAGAAYLCFLGIRMMWEARGQDPGLPEVKPRSADFDQGPPSSLPQTAESNPRLTRSNSNPPRAFWQGIATEVLNPKTALFFLSFIPQFVDRASPLVFLQFLALGTISVTLNTSADLIVILLAGPLGERIRSSAKFRLRQRTATGLIMIGLGTYLAASESK